MTLAPDLRFAAVGRSHVGCVRTLNEDRFIARGDAGLWAVADGMGGHQAGEVASQMVVDALGGLGRFGSGYAQLKAVGDALRGVNAELVRRASALPGGGVIGATVAALLVFEGHYCCVWAGDARIYRLRDGELERLTRDHSLVQKLVDSGDIAPEEAAGHPNANVVTRAVGAAPSLELDVEEGAARPGDVFLICSDGLTGALSEPVIAAQFRGVPLAAAADGLMLRALANGAKDNVSFVLVGVD
jgi:serine/threonine protein phosphatase PrpC